MFYDIILFIIDIMFYTNSQPLITHLMLYDEHEYSVDNLPSSITHLELRGKFN